MGNKYWSTELWRIALVIFIALVIGVQTGHWLICLILFLTGYIVWLFYKLQQLLTWLEKSAKPGAVPDSNGIWESITQQIQVIKKKSDIRKKAMGKLLKRSKIIISGLPYATVVLNDKNEIDWANKTSAKLLNIERKRDRGQRIDNLIRMPKIQQILAKKNTDEIEISLPYGARHKLALQLTVVQKDFKLLIARDISERVNILQMRKNFIANASHELKTPLTVITGYLEIMKADDGLPKHLHKDVSLVSAQAERMQDIIEDLLKLSRLENAPLTVNLKTIIDVAKIIKEVCHDELKLINNTHTIKMDLSSGLKIKGIETEITSICTNLIHNAIQHTKDGTLITVEWSRKLTGEACFIVKDNGQGIPLKHISHLTERFYQVDQSHSNKTGGTGLGLAIVQHSIQRHGGRLDIQSIENKETCFTVCFPSNRVVD